MGFHFINVFSMRKTIFKAEKIIHRSAQRKRIGQKLNFDTHFNEKVHFDRAVNCQPSYRAAAIIAEARIIVFIFIIFFRSNFSTFHWKSLIFAKNLDFSFFDDFSSNFHDFGEISIKNREKLTKNREIANGTPLRALHQRDTVKMDRIKSEISAVPS